MSPTAPLLPRAAAADGGSTPLTPVIPLDRDLGPTLSPPVSTTGAAGSGGRGASLLQPGGPPLLPDAVFPGASRGVMAYPDAGLPRSDVGYGAGGFPVADDRWRSSDAGRGVFEPIHDATLRGRGVADQRYTPPVAGTTGLYALPSTVRACVCVRACACVVLRMKGCDWIIAFEFGEHGAIGVAAACSR